MILSGLGDNRKITIGIRPEFVRVSAEQKPGMVYGELDRKSIVVGGQYLLAIKVGELLLKAKVEQEVGFGLSNGLWLECPLNWVMVFGAAGQRLEGVKLTPESP